MSDDTMTNQFLLWEAATRDVIDFKKTYCDVAGGDPMAGLMLSEIIYWYLPSKDGDPNKLRVRHKGNDWIAVRRYEWWDRCRLSPDESDNTLNKLIEAGVIEKGRFHFYGKPTVHIRVLWEVFLEKWQYLLEHPAQNPYAPGLVQPSKTALAGVYEEPAISPNGELENPISPNSEIDTLSISPNGENQFAKRREPIRHTAKYLTENTTEITAQNTNKPSGQNGGSVATQPRALTAPGGEQPQLIDYYPTKQRAIIETACRLWALQLPEISFEKGSEHLRWKGGAKRLEAACGEFGTEAIEKAYRDEQERDRRFRKRISWLGGPLVDLCGAAAAELRKQSQRPEVQPGEEEKLAAAYQRLYGQQQGATA